ncbi:universal stress protein [Marivirga sp. S37H4]|uniref:Universal stress protein n=1 Tax=Marivirga aurantiaca TaxID=2802615 RepID=A0A934WX28_9BACT|nr:universal stress protein [Marivirga aurantiaca]MBK6264410.1 universal stress protein [Marivirga aurantiaca]
MDRILCPVDFSEYSLNALEYAANLLQIKKGYITLLYIFTEHEFSKAIKDKDDPASFNSMKEHAAQKLKVLAEETENAFQVKCEYNMAIGGVDKTIASYADNNDFDYIVMGTMGNGYNESTIIGSRTMRTVKESKTPVITVPIQTTFNGLKSVVYASDYSESDKLIMQRLVSFVFPFHSRIRFVHISHSKNVMSENTYEAFKSDLDSFLGYDRVSYYLKEYKNDISHGIEEFVKEQHGDLLVLFKRKRNFLDNLISSSVSREISYLSSHPVLIYKE